MTRATAQRPFALLLALLLALPIAASPVAADEPSGSSEPDVAVTPTDLSQASDRVLVRFKDADRAAASARAHGLARPIPLGRPSGPQVVATNGRPVGRVLDELRADPNVVYAEPDYRIAIDGDVSQVAVNDPLTSGQYSLDRMRVRDAWNITTGAANAIAVLDTGVQFSHPDLVGRLLTGYDFVNQDTRAKDDNGHGTWVSGIIAANANDGIGLAGISWTDEILPVKIMDADGLGWTQWLIDGIYWATDHGASVINMSIGGFPASSAVQDAVNYAWSKGVVLVGAAGNNRRLENHYPASFQHVVSVTATQMDDEFTNFSNYGPMVDVSAPGGSVLTTNCNRSATGYGKCHYYGDTITISGTSFSTPNTSGVVALIRAVHPDWTPQQVVDQLLASVDDLGYPGWDNRYGWGRVNAYRAVGGSVAEVTSFTRDALEPNDGLSAAQLLSLGVTTSATIHPAGDEDWYAVDVPRAGRLDLTVTAVTDTTRPAKSSLPVDPILQVLTTGGTQLAYADDPTDSSATERASISATDAMRAIVHVSNWLPNGSLVPYTVRADYVDDVAPQIAARFPGPSTGVDRFVSPTITFDEPVTNVSDKTIVLRNTKNGRRWPIRVTYDATTSSAHLWLLKPLPAHTRIKLRVRGGVHDLAGNAISPVGWRFTTGRRALFDPAARLSFREGTFTGYRFAADGSVTSSRTYTLVHDSAANTTIFGRVSHQSGDWVLVSNGVWAGYWLRYSPGVFLTGTRAPRSPGPASLAAADGRVSFRKGTHTGYRFDARGWPLAVRTATLGSGSSAHASEEATITNQYGRWYRIVDGIWAGDWILASRVVRARP